MKKILIEDFELALEIYSTMDDGPTLRISAIVCIESDNKALNLWHLIKKYFFLSTGSEMVIVTVKEILKHLSEPNFCQMPSSNLI